MSLKWYQLPYFCFILVIGGEERGRLAIVVTTAGGGERGPRILSCSTTTHVSKLKMRLLYRTFNIYNICVFQNKNKNKNKNRDQSEEDAKALQRHWQSRIGQRKVLLL